MKMKTVAAGMTDVGQTRDHNEDSILISDRLGLYAVADGMGGHAAGEVASRTAITAIEEFVDHALSNGSIQWEFGLRDDLCQRENVLHTAVALANREVCRKAEDNLSYGGMGTTAAVLLVHENEAHIGHVGDSRVYLFRDGELEAQTQDHSWVHEQVQRNLISEDEARHHRWRNVITRALGNREAVEIDIKTVAIQPGDAFLLCSDGLTGMISDDEIAGCLAEHREDPNQICAELVRLANATGGQDNISVVLIQTDG